VKRRGESLDDRTDLGADRLYESQHGLLVKDGPRLLDLYLKRKLSLVLHVSVAGPEERDPRSGRTRQLSRVGGVERPALRPGVRVLDDSASRSVVSEVGARQVEYPMLVDVRQLMNMPKGMRLWGVPSLVRLEVADEAAMMGKQARVPPELVPLTQVFTTLREDRKRDVAGLPLIFRVSRWTSGDSDLPGDVVKAGMEVVGDVTKQRAPLGGRIGAYDIADLGSRLRIKLVMDSARLTFEESDDLVVQRADVYVCPVELQTSAV
jgi:hypothetical protein